ncbi:hypothetical protein DPMN_144455 [Dreissena polymorpha]|uniref:Uncharacterized protein n=1 Tax=Dreissena polymorpha TaxID=45954 RepID=A0A9D4GFN7_DREPO|nr:hypothetical protein DPMN_144455 [Dreissena polymorpha]
MSTPPINNPELILKSVTMDSTGCTIICCSNATYIKAKVPLSALTDARLVSRLVRRMNALPKEVFIPSGHWTTMTYAVPHQSQYPPRNAPKT